MGMQNKSYQPYRPYGEGIVFNMLMKALYIAYLAMYMAYAVLNYIDGTGNYLVNFIVALRNLFRIIKVGVSLLVLAQTISENSWDALTIAMLIISLPTSLLWLLGEYIYVAVAGIFRSNARRHMSQEDTDEEYEGQARVTPVHDTIERVKQFAESELIVMRPHEVDYDSDEVEDVNDGYLGYEDDDDFSYPHTPKPILPKMHSAPVYVGEFSVEVTPLDLSDDFRVEEYDMEEVLKK